MPTLVPVATSHGEVSAVVFACNTAHRDYLGNLPLAEKAAVIARAAGFNGSNRAYLEQLATFDEPSRDPLGRVVSVAWFALVPDGSVELATTDKYAAVAWWPVAKLPKLAYDHAHILEVAVSRVRAKLGYSNVAWSPRLPW